MHGHNHEDARYTLKRALSDAYYKHERKANEICHINGIMPKNLREMRDLFVAGHFEGYGDDEAMDAEFDFGVEVPVFRKVPADEERRNRIIEKLHDEKDAIKLKVEVLEPAEALPFVEGYAARTIH